MKKTTTIIIGAIIGVFIMWMGPNIIFNWDYGILFGLKEAIGMLSDNQLLDPAMTLIIIGAIVGGLFGYGFYEAINDNESKK